MSPFSDLIESVLDLTLGSLDPSAVAWCGLAVGVVSSGLLVVTPRWARTVWWWQLTPGAAGGAAQLNKAAASAGVGALGGRGRSVRRRCGPSTPRCRRCGCRRCATARATPTRTRLWAGRPDRRSRLPAQLSDDPAPIQQLRDPLADTQSAPPVIGSPPRSAHAVHEPRSAPHSQNPRRGRRLGRRHRDVTVLARRCHSCRAAMSQPVPPEAILCGPPPRGEGGACGPPPKGCPPGQREVAPMAAGADPRRRGRAPPGRAPPIVDAPPPPRRPRRDPGPGRGRTGHDTRRRRTAATT